MLSAIEPSTASVGLPQAGCYHLEVLKKCRPSTVLRPGTAVGANQMMTKEKRKQHFSSDYCSWLASAFFASNASRTHKLSLATHHYPQKKWVLAVHVGKTIAPRPQGRHGPHVLGVGKGQATEFHGSKPSELQSTTASRDLVAHVRDLNVCAQPDAILLGICRHCTTLSWKLGEAESQGRSNQTKIVPSTFDVRKQT